MTATLTVPPAVHPVGNAVYTPIFDRLRAERLARLKAVYTQAAKASQDALDAIGGIP